MDNVVDMFEWQKKKKRHFYAAMLEYLLYDFDAYDYMLPDDICLDIYDTIQQRELDNTPPSC